MSFSFAFCISQARAPSVKLTPRITGGSLNAKSYFRTMWKRGGENGNFLKNGKKNEKKFYLRSNFVISSETVFAICPKSFFPKQVYSPASFSPTFWIVSSPLDFTSKCLSFTIRSDAFFQMTIGAGMAVILQEKRAILPSRMVMFFGDERNFGPELRRSSIWPLIESRSFAPVHL